jgi:hypothetical protein
MMTRKDYVETAKIIGQYKYEMEDSAFERLVSDFSAMFALDNPRFLHDKFADACYQE